MQPDQINHSVGYRRTVSWKAMVKPSEVPRRGMKSLFDDLKTVPEMSRFRHDDCFTLSQVHLHPVNILRTITAVYNNFTRKLSSPSLTEKLRPRNTFITCPRP